MTIKNSILRELISLYDDPVRNEDYNLPDEIPHVRKPRYKGSEDLFMINRPATTPNIEKLIKQSARTVQLPPSFYFSKIQSVLLAEDLDRPHQEHKQKMEDWGLYVEGVYTAEMALAAYQPGKFDVLVFDHNFESKGGRKKGMDVLAEIRIKDPDVLMVNNSMTFSDLTALQAIKAASTGKDVDKLLEVLMEYEMFGFSEFMVKSSIIREGTGI